MEASLPDRLRGQSGLCACRAGLPLADDAARSKMAQPRRASGVSLLDSHWREITKALYEEDVDDFVRGFYPDSPTRLQLLAESHRHKAIFVSGNLGKTLTDSFHDLSNPLMTLSGRKLSFSQDWRGPHPLEMALAGFFYTSTGQVECCNCGLQVRDASEPRTCPWRVHMELAPRCVHLARYNAQGPSYKRSKLIRVNSTSAFLDLLR
ncbi:uncharacterized protein LOC112566880 isoform X1 [Pomacea canaliculata]|uniref:uncharacterized protein LOC112566880 isoform X1 n=2 Tax=Pomacea canaliculata TaxID=400727 RepID=UPI000D728D85|nr:uncharacterized protein LOC112566880 isoform X1 [Pomacea canaliculata]